MKNIYQIIDKACKASHIKPEIINVPDKWTPYMYKNGQFLLCQLNFASYGEPDRIYYEKKLLNGHRRWVWFKGLIKYLCKGENFEVSEFGTSDGSIYIAFEKIAHGTNI